MNFLPVIVREMRLVSRRPWTYRTRLLFALAGMAACFLVLLSDPPSTQRGRALLWTVSIVGLAFSLLAGCFVTSDSLSSEKREGTLGLLFLSTLRGRDVVLGKMFSSGIHTGFGILAVFPIFFLPLLNGGVTWSEVSRILLALLIALLFSLSLGMLISSLVEEARKAVMATFLWLVLINAIPLLCALLYKLFTRRVLPPSGIQLLSPCYLLKLAFDPFLSSGGLPPYWKSVLLLLSLSAIFLLAASILLPWSWKRAHLGSATPKPRAQSKRKSKRSLSLREWDPLGVQNPYKWLCSRGPRESVWFRLFRRALIGFWGLMLLVSILTKHWEEGFVTAMFTCFALHLLHKTQLALEAGRQFNEDRRSGSLEILLSTPLPESKIVDGQLDVINQQFRARLKTLITLNAIMLLWIYGFQKPLHMDGEVLFLFSTFFIGGILAAISDFRTLKWKAMSDGLRLTTHLKASLRTMASVFVFPWVLFFTCFALGSNADADGAAVIFMIWFAITLLINRIMRLYVMTRLRGDFRAMVSEGA